LALFWTTVAASAPSGDRSDPGNPAYTWGPFDRQVMQARAVGLDPLVYISGSPTWARDRAAGGAGTTWPRPAELARFAEAAARRYGGAFQAEGAALPRVRYWQVWNEPAARSDLKPQFRGNRPVAVGHYRRMVNAFAVAVHRVHADNLVVAGGLGPFGHNAKDIQVVAPLRFMSLMLCVARKPPHRRTCAQRSTFDVWSHNPYTNGGPTRHAAGADDVSLGDLPEMRSVLDAAVRAHTILSKRHVEFWVTEISWDTRPSDPRGVPMTLHARWVAEALYRMWASGVSLVTWYRLRDDPLRESPYQSGMYFVDGEPKLSLRAFRFPFVALRTRRGVQTWGRTPDGKTATVVIEQVAGGGWRELATMRADQFGIFSKGFRGPRSGSLRARLASGDDVSVPFALAAPRDRRVDPFGCGGSIHC